MEMFPLLTRETMAKGGGKVFGGESSGCFYCPAAVSNMLARVTYMETRVSVEHTLSAIVSPFDRGGTRRVLFMGLVSRVLLYRINGKTAAHCRARGTMLLRARYVDSRGRRGDGSL